MAWAGCVTPLCVCAWAWHVTLRGKPNGPCWVCMAILAQGCRIAAVEETGVSSFRSGPKYLPNASSPPRLGADSRRAVGTRAGWGETGLTVSRSWHPARKVCRPSRQAREMQDLQAKGHQASRDLFGCGAMLSASRPSQLSGENRSVVAGPRRGDQRGCLHGSQRVGAATTHRDDRDGYDCAP